MADFLQPDEGANYMLANGLPATCYFLLSTKSVGATSPLSTSDTLAGGVGEITGTGYSRKNQGEPTPASRAAVFTSMAWTTGVATDWPSTVRSILLVTTADNTGKVLGAWNLQAGGTARDLSAASTTETVTPTLSFS